MKIGAALLKARKAHGLTQSGLAGVAGVSRTTVQELEAGGGTVASLQLIAPHVEFRIAGLPRRARLGDRLLAARKARGWSQEKLADRAGLSTPTVRSLEAGVGQLKSLEAVIAALAPTARVRASEKARWEGGGRDVRLTPVSLLEAIVGAMGPISLDPCAANSSAVIADRYIDEAEDGLVARWSGSLAFMNPPFSQASKWIDRAYRAWSAGEVETVVALLPVRTNTKAFFEQIAGHADVLFLPGRPRFSGVDGSERMYGVAFGLMVVVWGGEPSRVADLRGRLEAAHARPVAD